MSGEFLQNSASDLIAAFGRLIRVRGSSQGDGFVGLHPSEFTAQQVGSMLLHIDFLLELQAVAHFHELVGVAGIAVAASELASAVGIDSPGKWHLALADASV